MRNPKFATLTAQMNALHDKKNADYASDANPYSNFEEAAQVAAGFSGVDAVFASLIGVKLARLRELTRAQKTPNHESIQDTRTDLAMYAALWASYHAPAAFITNEQPVNAATITPMATIPRPTYDERRSNLTPCKCGAIFTHPHLCDANEKCMAARHPHFLTDVELRRRNP
jgi:hypothetical protein